MVDVGQICFGSISRQAHEGLNFKSFYSKEPAIAILKAQSHCAFFLIATVILLVATNGLYCCVSAEQEVADSEDQRTRANVHTGSSLLSEQKLEPSYLRTWLPMIYKIIMLSAYHG